MILGGYSVSFRQEVLVKFLTIQLLLMGFLRKYEQGGSWKYEVKSRLKVIIFDDQTLDLTTLKCVSSGGFWRRNLLERMENLQIIGLKL